MFTRAALILLAAIAAAVPARAQFDKMPGFVKQIEIGYGYSFCTADYILKLKGVTPNGLREVDTTITSSVKTKGGATETFGTSLRLKRLGEKSTLSLGVDLVYSGYIWDFHTPTSVRLIDSGFRPVYDNQLGGFDGASFTAAGLLTADIKFGAEAMMEKRYRWCWTIGAGVMPSVSATAGTNIDAAIGFGVQPVIKGEVGIRGPIVAKLRLQYSIGNVTLMDSKPSPGFEYVTGTVQQNKITEKSNFTVSLLLLPFSWMYKRSEWYNTY